MAYIEINKGKKIILGSNSPRRKQFINYPNYTVYENIASPLAITGVKDDEIIITADTIVWAQNEHLGKPNNITEAKKFLEKLSNMKHEVITSVCFTEKEKQTIISESTFVLFKKLSISEINYYLNIASSFFFPFLNISSFGSIHVTEDKFYYHQSF